MTRYLLAIYHPDDYDPGTESAQMRNEISAVNAEMVAAGVRVFVGGLTAPSQGVAIRTDAAGHNLVTDGPYLETKEHIGGVWVIEVATRAEALEWARKATVACRVPVELRPFH